MNTYVIIWLSREDWDEPTIMHTDADTWDEAHAWALKELDLTEDEVEEAYDSGAAHLIVQDIRE